MTKRKSKRGKWNRKLSDEDVALMRKMYWEFAYPWRQRQLADKFGVSQGHVADILNGKKRKEEA